MEPDGVSGMDTYILARQKPHLTVQSLDRCAPFRLSRLEIHRTVCKLRLIRHGLLKEAGMIDTLHLHDTWGKRHHDDGKSATDCDFSGVATVQNAASADTCTALLSAVGTAGTGSVPTATGTQGTGAASSSSSFGIPGYTAPVYFAVGKALLVAYGVVMVISGVGMIVL